MPKLSGFKLCEDCHRQMPISDPHQICLWCLGSDHDTTAGAECKSMHTKAICEREMERLAAWQKTPCRFQSQS